ncbi:MAG: site-specific integrase [Candidatus Omnitrophota bacterium]|nr:site-specific integrase [Candidatus Omnitrophota bacterium]
MSKAFKIAKELNHINENPVSGVSKIKAPAPAIDLYTQDEIRIMLKYSKKDPLLETLILLLLQTGIRKEEIVHFKWNDFNKDNRTLRVSKKDGWNPKRGKERMLILSYRLTEMIDNLERKDEYIFTQTEGRNKGKRFSGSQIYRYIKEDFLDSLSIAGYLHKFRDTYASYSIAGGVDVAKVQWRLGHSSLKETDKYAMAINEVISEDIKTIFIGGKAELRNG